MFKSYGVGRYQASEPDAVYKGRLAAVGQRGVLRFGGLNSTPATDLVGAADKFRALTDRDLIVCHAQMSSTSHFGNDTAQTRAGTARSYLQATWGAASGKVLLTGGSMGGLLGLLWTLENPDLVAAFAFAVPAVSLIDLHDNDRASLASTIETAYGGLSNWNAEKADHDPLTRAAEFVSLGVPGKLWYSNNDDLCIPSLTEEFCETSEIPGVNMGDQTTGPSGHEGHAAYDDFAAEAADFLHEHSLVA